MKRQWSEGDGDRCGEERKRKCGRMRECPKSVLFGACLSAFLLLLFLGMRERDRERESGQKISCVGGKLDVRDVMVTERNEGKHTTLACTKARMRNILGPITHTQRCRNGKMDEIAARTHTHAHT